MPRLTSKGQVTIPKSIRDRFGLRAGSEVDFVVEDGVIRLVKRARHERLDRWVGSLDLDDAVDRFVDDLRGEP